MSRNTISINSKEYSKIKEYCKKNAFKINAWVEKILINEINSSNESIK
jgi:hypothetical protein